MTADRLPGAVLGAGESIFPTTGAPLAYVLSSATLDVAAYVEWVGVDTGGVAAAPVTYTESVAWGIQSSPVGADFNDVDVVAVAGGAEPPQRSGLPLVATVTGVLL